MRYPQKHIQDRLPGPIRRPNPDRGPLSGTLLPQEKHDERWGFIGEGGGGRRGGGEKGHSHPVMWERD